jgi:hypothetical protein
LFFSALLCSLALQLLTTMRIMIQYNTYEGDFSSFPSYNLKLSNRIKAYIYFTFITLNAYNRQMRENAQDLRYNLQTIKENYIFPDITLMFHLFKFKTSSKCALVHIQLSSTCACLRCSCIILLWLKNSWTPVHELLHRLSMFLDICFTFPTGILNRVSFPFYQIFKICLLRVFLLTL